jgi:Leucine-rich repeat (LRR) protein
MKNSNNLFQKSSMHSFVSYCGTKIQRNFIAIAFVCLTGSSTLVHAQQAEILEDKSYLKNKEEVAKQRELKMLNLAETQQVSFNSLQHALQHREKVKMLDLSNQELTAFPIEILLFKNLETLDLSGNQIKEIPATISTLSNLKILAIENNQLKILPETISELHSLEYLLIRFNQKDFILPTTIANLKNLKVLHCTHLADLPNDIFKINSLEILKVWHSNIDTLPSDVKNLNNLKEICLQNNKLSSLPSELYSLPVLEYLNLGGNQFSSLPADINKLKKLDYLGVYDNPIHTLPLESDMFRHLRFLSIWNTKLAKDFMMDVNSNKKSVTRIYTTTEGLH